MTRLVQELIAKRNEELLNSAAAQAWNRKTDEQKAREAINDMTKDNIEWHQKHGREVTEDQARREVQRIAENVERKK